MKILITLDYEVYFGKNTGSIDECIIYPSKILSDIAENYKAKLIFFVDAGYLLKLKEYVKKYKHFQKDYDKIINQLKEFVKLGHSIQLHIHSHWETSYYNGEEWSIDYSHYKLQSFSETEISEIILKYKNELENICNIEVYAFRAGGWCIQPFNKIKDALYKNNIKVDSSVVPNNYSGSFDFRNSPPKTFWNFYLDPTSEEVDGSFLEVPISSIKVPNLFYWKLLLSKTIKTEDNKTLGDGIPLNPDSKSIAKWLLLGNYSTVSIDGLKSSLLLKALDNYVDEYSDEDYFTIIGHPKSQSNYSMKKIKEFLEYSHKKHDFIDFNYFREHQII